MRPRIVVSAAAKLRSCAVRKSSVNFIVVVGVASWPEVRELYCTLTT
jgi:hypothetical protein